MWKIFTVDPELITTRGERILTQTLAILRLLLLKYSGLPEYYCVS
jgi:hypothetical protein